MIVIVSQQVHDYRAVLSVFRLMDGEFSGAIVTKLFTDTFTAHIREAIHQDTTPIPIAPDTFAFTIFPEAFICHLSTQAVGIKTSAFPLIASFPNFLVTKAMSIL